jgi:glycosyltransferase involved in cell wall biosynthesis
MVTSQLSSKEQSPKVSVCVMTYNQVRYIRQCLQSLVDQKTNFDFEVIVADDCSGDGTQEIVKEFEARYPGCIKALFNGTNLGPAGNYLQIHGLARGQYIAQMDGDDYALPGKLQAQADFLDQHPECTFVWHRMFVLYEATGTMVEDPIRPELLPRDGFTRGDLLRYITIGPNGSKMYRATVRELDLPAFPVLDFFVNVDQIGNGTATFVGDEPLMVYRARIGIASRGNFVNLSLRNSLLHLYSKYPQYRVQISTAAVGRLVVAIQNGNWRDFVMFAGLVAKVFRCGSVRDILAHWRFLMMFRLP